MDQTEQLKGKYRSAIDKAKQVGVHLEHVHMEGGKLLIQGAAPNEQIKNEVWNEIKRIDPSYSDLKADIRIDASLPVPQQAQQTGQSGMGMGSGGVGGGMQTYTVKSGDSLSKIAQQFYGSAGQYMKIFEANKDQLNDPNMIHPGQVLKIPQ